MYILGISCFYHDSAACIVIDGQVVAALQEERFSRKKHDASFPHHSIKFCLEQVKTKPDYVVFYEKPFLKFERVLTTILQTTPNSYWVFRDALGSWFKEKLWIRHILSEKIGIPASKILFVPHHLSHAASAFLCSPFPDSAILTVDGVGEWSTASISKGITDKYGNRRIKILEQMLFPHSLGLLYSTFTAFLGFRVNSGEYKVMGMAAYGQPKYISEIKKVVSVNSNGSIILDLSYFSFHYHRSQSFSKKFLSLFGQPRKGDKDYKIGTPQAQKYADIAASIQKVTENIIIKMARHAKKLTKSENICLAGGVALNSVANYKLYQTGFYKNMFIQPAAGDAGGAMGAALYVSNLLNTVTMSSRPRRNNEWSDLPHTGKAKENRNVDKIKTKFHLTHAYWGKHYTVQEIKTFIKSKNFTFQEYKTEPALINFVVNKLINKKVVAWFQGKFEWGPRALGSRSILADARHKEIQDIVNSKIKFRELFRPFAPSVLADKAHEILDVPKIDLKQKPFRYMLYVVPVKKTKQPLVSAITHINGSARPHLVDKDTNPLYYNLIKAFYKKTGIPLILNTSFNLRGEPIVNSPQDALQTFMNSNIDYLVMENFVIKRK